MSDFYDSWRGGGTGLGAYILQSNTAANIALVAKGAASQTAKVLDVQNSAGTSVFSVDNSGNLVLSGSVTATIDETISGNLALTGNLTVNGNSTLGNASTDTVTLTGGIASTVLFGTHNTYDIGSATAAPRDLFVGRASTFSGAVTANSTVLLRGVTTLENHLQWSSGVAVQAGQYSIGRDADGTNQLHFNVPTGATYEWSVNDSAEMVLSATVLSPGADDGSALGSTTLKWADLFLASGGVINFNNGV